MVMLKFPAKRLRRLAKRIRRWGRDRNRAAGLHAWQKWTFVADRTPSRRLEPPHFGC
jgi:hypothetical protein